MTREELIEMMARAVLQDHEDGANMDTHPVPERAATRHALAALAALEAAGVRLVYSGEAPAQLIDGDERTTVRIFTPYAPPSPGAITGMRKAEDPCLDCIDGWCQMNCGPRLT